MDFILLIFLMVIAIAMGVIPLVGTGYGFVILILGELNGWSNEEMLFILIALFIGSIVGVILGYMVEVGSLGFIWFWSRGSFANLTAAIGQIGTILFGMFTGSAMALGVLALGIVVMRKDSKHLPKKCASVLGHELCVGSEEVE